MCSVCLAERQQIPIFIVFGLQLPGLEPTIYRTRWTIQWLKEKGQTMIYKTLHGKLKIVQLESHSKIYRVGEWQTNNILI